MWRVLCSAVFSIRCLWGSAGNSVIGEICRFRPRGSDPFFTFLCLLAPLVTWGEVSFGNCTPGGFWDILGKGTGGIISHTFKAAISASAKFCLVDKALAPKECHHFIRCPVVLNLIINLRIPVVFMRLVICSSAFNTLIIHRVRSNCKRHQLCHFSRFDGPFSINPAISSLKSLLGGRPRSTYLTCWSGLGLCIKFQPLSLGKVMVLWSDWIITDLQPHVSVLNTHQTTDLNFHNIYKCRINFLGFDHDARVQ